MEKDVFYKLDFLHIFHCICTTSRFLVPKKMAHTRQTAQKSNKGLPKATKGEQGRKGGGGGVGSGGSGSGSGGDGFGSSGGGSGSGGSGMGSSDGNRNAKGNIPSGRFSQQLENRPPATAHRWKKPYMWAFQEMRKLRHTTKLCISKYQMAR